MKRKLLIRRKAQAEIRSAAKWYDKRRAGLGDELLAEVGQTLAIITRRPEMFPVVYLSARRALLDRFPYAVYFVTTDKLVAIVAFLHGHQDRDAQFAGRV